MVVSEGLDKHPGVTKPLSLAGPSEADLVRNKELEKFLADAGLQESIEEASKRQEVLSRIREVHGPGADIDTLCIGPSYVSWEDLDISDVFLLYNVDEQTVRSLNGCRVADQILKLVPNVEVVAGFAVNMLLLYCYFVEFRYPFESK